MGRPEVGDPSSGEYSKDRPLRRDPVDRVPRGDSDSEGGDPPSVRTDLARSDPSRAHGFEVIRENERDNH